MLKLKKILSSFICLLVMLAFISAIGFAYGCASVTKARTEVSAKNQQATLNLSLIAEERDESTDHYDVASVPVQIFVSAFIFSYLEQPLLPFVFTCEKPLLKNSLYINFRSLRL